MAKRCRFGVLMVNTGTPSAPTPRAVRRYLGRFLMHPRIAPMNRVLWWVVLHVCILPKRGKASAAKYASIWTDEGSPLAVAHERLERGVADELGRRGFDAEVRCAMSFGEPRVVDSLRSLRSAGCTHLVVLPLYPQSAFSTTGIVRDDVAAALRKLHWKAPCAVIDDYHDNPTYLAAIASSIRHAGFDAEGDDKLLFSFHSVPLTDIERGDVYELQTGATSLGVANELGLGRERWTIGYQCRFDKGRDWLAPTTADVMERWAGAGVGRVFAVCPNFAVDCLETLHDVKNDLGPSYLRKRAEAGHPTDTGYFTYVPCLGATKAHVRVICDVLQPYLNR